MIVFLMTTPIRCYNTPSESTFYLHFVQKDDTVKVEHDSYEPLDSQNTDRSSKGLFWPVIVETRTGEAKQFLKAAHKYLALCEESVRPVRTLKCCNRRGRSNCYLFFRGLFGQPK
jgi:hypothetical protein